MNESSADERLAALLWRAARASGRYYQAQLAELDLTTRQAAAILALVDRPGATLGGLAEALRADQATASTLIDRLLAADLVKRETDPQDRRRAKLYPTDKAMRIAERLAQARHRTEEVLVEILGERYARKLRSTLARLSEELERSRESVAAGSRSAP